MIGLISPLQLLFLSPGLISTCFEYKQKGQWSLEEYLSSLKDKKVYYNHSGYPGGLRERTARTMQEKYPVEMVERAVKGMLPKNRLGRQIFKQLFVYAGSEHPHAAQQPKEIKVGRE